MTALCPRGHTSEADDYCDQCGARMGAPAVSTGAGAGAGSPAGSDPVSGPGSGSFPAAPAAPVAGPGPASGPSLPCPTCGTLNPVGGRFCEDCGFDLDTGVAPVAAPAAEVPAAEAPGAEAPAAGAGTPGSWEAVAHPDRDYFDRMQAEGVDFPVAGFERHFELLGDTVTIGRRSASRGITPDIDLSSGPTDGGVSHAHAVLVRQTDGGWAIVDSGSANGTYLNQSDEALPVNEVTDLADGDQIHLGAWTTLTVRRVPEEEGLLPA